MDEKASVSLNALNKAFEKQVTKRVEAPAPTPEKATTYLSAVTKASSSTKAATDFDSFFEAWDRYYPTIVSLLGYASWFIPGKAVDIIKALLAVINNNVIPILRDLAK